MFKRPYLKSVKKRVSEQRRTILVVMGPRQVGKTTMITQLTDEIDIPWIFESADAVFSGNSLWLNQIWETARIKLKTESAREYLLIIDEIQKIENWSETVKKLWDEDTRNKTNLKVILLGSSRLLLKRGLTESLAGRFETIYMTHWTFNEMSDAFGWDENEFAWFGGYPGGVDLIKDEDRWKKYIQDAIIEASVSKDILMLTRVDKPALMKQLFEIGSSYSGQILSITKILGQLQDAGNTTTLTHYLTLLDTAGLLGFLNKYALNIVRKRSSIPKFQVHNNALLSAQQPEHLHDIISMPDRWGRIVESSIGTHLLNHALSEKFSLYYWREGNDEVDFIMEKGSKLIAIEVKTSYATNKKGIVSFNTRFNPYKSLLIDNNNMPWHEFLRINPAELF